MPTSDIQPAAAAEYDILVKNAQDAAARRMQNAVTISAADAAQRDLAFQLKRIDALTPEQLLQRAEQRTQRANQA